MSFYHARKAVRERIAKNRRRYSEAPPREALEAQAIRALSTQSAPIFDKRHFRPLKRSGVTRWVLQLEAVQTLRKLNAANDQSDLGGMCYCRECGHDISRYEYRIPFEYRWDANSETQIGFIHCGECTRLSTF
jgi:hypothetical protein